MPTKDLLDDTYKESRDRLRDAITQALTTDEAGKPLGVSLTPRGRVYLSRTPALDGKRLRAMRHKQGLSILTLAQQSGLSVSNIRRLEANRRPNVRAVTLARLTLALRVDLYYLLGLSDEPEPWKNKVRIDRSGNGGAR